MATPPSSVSTSERRLTGAILRPRWELLVDEPMLGAENMARDRALLDELVAGRRGPTLRFYGWAPACISLGLGQREEILDLDAVRAAGLDVVRRPTGGQALLHDDEVTYSVVASQQDPLVGGTLMATYHALTEAFLSGLRDLGIEGEGAPCEPRPAAGLTSVCFASASAEEVLVGGRKLVASAQWRSRGAFLQHGSLLLTDRQAELPGLMRDAAARALLPMSVSLAELMPSVPPREALVARLVHGFESALGIELVAAA
ncbi:MAG: lipoyl(octanoyl) transferase [Chloroflexota bacterium]|jgi:lipoate-protein ligase A|nr:lipoyl(octanoyl) transferase [Chloroflexota bacterium]